MLRKLLIWSLPLLLAAVGVFAQETSTSKDLQEMQNQATRLDSETNPAQGEQAAWESLSRQLNVPVDTLKAQQQSTGFGFGQLVIANSLATATGKTFDAISQEFKSGTGWGEIAKANNVKVGKIVSNLKRANKQIMKHHADNEATASSAAGANRGSSAARSTHADTQKAPRTHGGPAAGSQGKR